MKKELFIENKGVKIHCLQFNENDQEIPIIIVPGAVSPAEKTEWGLAGKLNRYHIIMSLRGRGQSDSPVEGYTLDDQASDISAVINHFKLEAFYLFGFSLGSSIGIRAASQHVGQIKGIMLGDYPPFYPAYNDEWKARVKAAPSPFVINDLFIDGIVRDGVFTPLVEDLSSLNCKILIFVGGKQSLIPPEALEKIKIRFPEAIIEVMEECTHYIFRPDPEDLVGRMERFIAAIEKETT